MNMAIHLLWHPINFFWNNHHDTYKDRTDANHFRVFCPEYDSIDLPRLTGILGTHTNVSLSEV